MRRRFGKTFPLSLGILSILFPLVGCSSGSGSVKGIIHDATMNTVTLVTEGNDTLSFSTMEADREAAHGLSLGDTLEVFYDGAYAVGMPARKLVLYPAPRRMGGDRDEHGCLSSAGYVWSEALKDCVRLFERGIRLSSVAKADEALYLVFSEDSAQVELFPSGGFPKKLLDRRALPAGGFVWNVEDDDTENVRFVDGRWEVSRRGKLLYVQNPAKFTGTERSEACPPR